MLLRGCSRTRPLALPMAPVAGAPARYTRCCPVSRALMDVVLMPHINATSTRALPAGRCEATASSSRLLLLALLRGGRGRRGGGRGGGRGV